MMGCKSTKGGRLAVLLAAFFPLAAAGAPGQELSLGMVEGTIALYQFNEGSGLTTADEAGTHAGYWSDTAAPLWTTGQGGTGGALGFTPASTAMYINDYSIAVGSTWTIQAVVQLPVALNAVGFNTLAGWGYGGGQHVTLKAGELGTTISNVTTTYAGTGFNVNTLTGWHLISAVGSGGTTTFYVDGTEVGVVSSQLTRDVWAIGGINANSPWGGPIDALRIMNVARSAQDIADDAYVLPPTPPPAPQGIRQIDSNGDSIAPGSSIRGSFSVEADIDPGTPADVRLEVEVKPVGVPFDGSGLVEGDEAAPGSVATAQIDGLSIGSYRWRVRTAYDANSLTSAWISFGTNPDNQDEIDVIFTNDSPAALAPAVLRNAETGVALSPGQKVDDLNGLQIDIAAADPDQDSYRLEVEAVRFGSSFTGLPTGESGQVDSGETASLTLILPVGRYCWQSRVVDSLGAASAWTPAGDGSSPDITVQWAGSRNIESGGGCGGHAGPAPVAALALILAGLSASRRRAP